MQKNKKQGFGLGSLIVIIALVLIVGAYMYYKGNGATPVMDQSAETTYPPTGSEAPAGQMEQGDEAANVVSTSNTGSNASATTTATTTPVKK